MESLDNLENLKLTIEKMNNYHQVEVLRILSRHLCKLNENKSGVYINLSYVDKPVIEDLQKYIKYTIDQESTLTTTEYQKTEFRTALFDGKEDKDIESITYNIEC
tara:strand:- start:1501 stop:1815 length:315 start_codon:yes stop_codon:yes gene_type:complete